MATEKNQPDTPQPDAPAPEGPSPIELAVEENKSKIVFVVLGLAVAICAVFAYFYFQKQKQDEAALAFTDAETIEEYNLVALEHPGTTAAGNALLRAADLLAADTNYADALKKLDTFLGDFTSHPRYAQGLLAKGSIAYSKGDLDTAETTFKKITSEHKESDVAALAHVRLGDIAWDRGKKDEALVIYQDLASKFPYNPFIDRTNERIRMANEPEPAEPSDRQKKLKEEEEAKRAELEANAKKAADEALKKVEDSINNPPADTLPTTIDAPSLTDPGTPDPELNLDPPATDDPAPAIDLGTPEPTEPTEPAEPDTDAGN